MEKNDFKKEGLTVRTGRFSSRIQTWTQPSTKKVFQALLLKTNGETYYLCFRSLSLARVGVGKCVFIIRMMMHFHEDHQMNLPYLLLSSLRKMATNVQNKIQCVENTMYHYVLVKIFVKIHLRCIWDDWESFLIRNHFEEKSMEKPGSNRALRGGKRMIEMMKE